MDDGKREVPLYFAGRATGKTVSKEDLEIARLMLRDGTKAEEVIEELVKYGYDSIHAAQIVANAKRLP